MSNLQRLDGERVFCHQCSNEWDRAQGGLTCPRCEGEFVEILSGDERPPEADDLDDLFPGQTAASPPRHRSPFDHDSPQVAGDPLRDPFRTRTPFDDHNPWADVPDPPEGDISTFHFATPGGGRGTFSYTSRTFSSPPPLTPHGGSNTSIFQMGPRAAVFNTGPAQARMQPGDILSAIMRSMEAFQPGMNPQDGQRMQGGLFANGGAFGGNGQHPPGPFDLLSAMMNPGAVHGRHGDMVWSDEALDRIVEGLLAQETNTAPPPASADAIRNLPKKKADKGMLGEDGTAECSICMDNVEFDSEVTVLPCNHWFHEDCVVAWLKEHDTCPHCRKPISPQDEPSTPGPRRRPYRRSSSTTSPPGGEGTQQNPWPVPHSPSSIREARNRHYARQDAERSRDQARRDRESARRSDSPVRPSQPEQYYGGRHESTDYYGGAEPNRRQSSRSYSQSQTETQSSSTGGGVTGWIRSHLPGGGGGSGSGGSGGSGGGR